MTERTYDIVVWGASGFTGRLVAEYLAAHYRVDGSLKWAIAGRNLKKLAAVAAEVGAEGAPVIEADADDPSSLDARQTKVVVTTVGPYQKYGSALVAACAAAGTDYVDLSGEPPWMRRMIDAHDEAAAASGAPQTKNTASPAFAPVCAMIAPMRDSSRFLAIGPAGPSSLKLM